MKPLVAIVLAVIAVPVCALEMKSARLQGGINYQPKQHHFFKARVNSEYAPIQGQAESEPSIEGSVHDLNRKLPANLVAAPAPDRSGNALEATEDHGELTVGVLGASVYGHRIKEVFPGSDLNRYEVRPGDVMLRIDGQDWRDLRTLIRLTQGPPGSIIRITVKRWEQIVTVPVHRVDSRVFVNCNTQGSPNANYFRQCAAKTRKW